MCSLVPAEFLWTSLTVRPHDGGRVDGDGHARGRTSSFGPAGLRRGTADPVDRHAEVRLELYDGHIHGGAYSPPVRVRAASSRPGGAQAVPNPTDEKNINVRAANRLGGWLLDRNYGTLLMIASRAGSASSPCPAASR
jgi:hypothetical protein